MVNWSVDIVGSVAMESWAIGGRFVGWLAKPREDKESKEDAEQLCKHQLY